MRDEKVTTSVSHGQDSKSLVSLFATVGDTTWRMFVPTLTLTFFGFWIDKRIGTFPWLMIAGVVFGFGLSVILVWEQIRRIKGGKR